MASKKRGRKKASKKKISKPRRVVKKRAKKVSVTVPKASLSNELGILRRIEHKVARIDHTVNAGRYLSARAKRAKRKSDLDSAWSERGESGLE
jgi:hypothetical protein